jgi:hypothetical protein
MRKICLEFFVVITLIFGSCNKSGEDIDVSQQWTVDYNGNLVNGPNDGQWSPKEFSSPELNLFSSLDTASLEGTVKPDSVFTSTAIKNCIFPNPFRTSASFVFNFSSGFNGLLEFKFVIVDDHLKIIDKGAFKIQATSYPNIPENPSTSGLVTLTPNLSSGKYRIYFTLSSSASQHFYKTWGNIEKSQ